MRNSANLQVAIDLTNLGKAIRIAHIANELGADIIEVGTPLIKKYGMLAVETIKEISESSLVVADMKTLDTGYLEATMAFRSGADIVTVSGLAPHETIKAAISAAREFKGKICVDLLGTTNLREKIESLKAIDGIDFYLVHLGVDQQTNKQLLIEKLVTIANSIDSSKLAVAGGINKKTISTILKFKPKIIVVGSAIYNADDPREAIKELLSIIRQFG